MTRYFISGLTHLYKVETHPLNGNFYIQKYEIIRSTPKKFYIQVRDVKNKEAEKVTKEIWKDVVRHPLPTMNDYFYSAREAWEDFIAKQKNKILFAQREIERANTMIENLKRDIPEAGNYESS